MTDDQHPPEPLEPGQPVSEPDVPPKGWDEDVTEDMVKPIPPT